MRKLILLLCALMLSGCASLTYTAPDGTQVTYTRFMTGSDTIKGRAGTATIEAQGQKQYDPNILQSLAEILSKVK